MKKLKNKVFVLGATGSIGDSSLKAIRKTDSSLIGVSFYKNIKKIREIIKDFNPKYVISFDLESYKEIKKEIKKVYFGIEGLEEVIAELDKDVKFINGIYGIEGIKPSFIIGKNGFDLLLANKESIVMGSKILKKNFTRSSLLPIDSEHWAMFNLLNILNRESIKEYYITASGGVLLKYDNIPEDISIETLKKHPVWDMGLEITINSSTMANKGLEIIEAKEIFNIKPSEIKVVIHPEAIVHTMVRLKSGAIISYASNPDMCEPIIGAIKYPDYYYNEFQIENKILNFINLDFKKYPMLKIAYEVAEKGGAYQICYTVANEFFVKKLIEGKIKFLEITKYVEHTISKFNFLGKIESIEDIYSTIDYSKEICKNIID